MDNEYEYEKQQVQWHMFLETGDVVRLQRNRTIGRETKKEAQKDVPLLERLFRGEWRVHSYWELHRYSRDGKLTHQVHRDYNRLDEFHVQEVGGDLRQFVGAR